MRRDHRLWSGNRPRPPRPGWRPPRPCPPAGPGRPETPGPVPVGGTAAGDAARARWAVRRIFAPNAARRHATEYRAVRPGIGTARARSPRRFRYTRRRGRRLDRPTAETEGTKPGPWLACRLEDVAGAAERVDHGLTPVVDLLA